MNTEAYNIFYTDDDMDDRDIFKDAADQVSHFLQIMTQASGDELISLLHHPPPFPKLIFLDLNMPIKNGYQVLQEIKQSALIKHIPIIIFSTSNDEMAIKITQQLGANLYIQKPSSFSSLKKVISHTLSINWETFTSTKENFVYKAN